MAIAFALTVLERAEAVETVVEELPPGMEVDEGAPAICAITGPHLVWLVCVP